jgi:hypothetical protein
MQKCRHWQNARTGSLYIRVLYNLFHSDFLNGGIENLKRGSNALLNVTGRRHYRGAVEVSREKSSPMDIIVNLSLSGKMFASPTFFFGPTGAAEGGEGEEGNLRYY